MENKVLIDLGIKYGLNTERLSKITDMAYQSGIADLSSKEAFAVMNYVCENDMVDKPAEEILEALKLEGLA